MTIKPAASLSKKSKTAANIIFEKMSGGEAVLLEAQGYDDVYCYHRTVMGRMMYHIQKKFTGKLRTVVMFLEESHYHAASKLAHHFDGSSELAFQPTVFIFGQKDVSELENLDDVRLVPLYPLCKVSPEQIGTTAPKWAERIKTAAELSETERRDLLSYLGGFMMHRLKESNLENINKLLGGFKMEDTQAGKDLIAIGVRMGREEGQELGAILAMRENIVDLLTVKLGRTEKTWRKELNSIKDIKVLKTLYRAILQAKTRKQAKEAYEAVFGNGKKAK
ncbi:hypothetical protein L0337_06560 [candidate division KSB1 bacterium]|nr:hypothetical protein [candidate division KSB1 bacterium]